VQPLSGSLAEDCERGYVRRMRDLLLLAIHLLVTLAKLLRPGGARAVAAESLLLKQQLLVINRSRARAPNLTTLDRFVLAMTTLFIRPHRIPTLAAILKPATLFKFHKALVERKYRLLFSSSFRGKRNPGPKGPSAELIAAIVELKRRNPLFGCVRIAEQISHAFGVLIDKDVVRRALTKTFSAGRLQWPFLADVYRTDQGQPLESGSVPLRIDPAAHPLGYGGHGCVHPPNRWLRCRIGFRRWRIRLPDVQASHCRPALA